MATTRKPMSEVRADGNIRPDAEPIEVTELTCPRCDTALHYTPKRWLYCPRCNALPMRSAGSSKTHPTPSTAAPLAEHARRSH